MAATVSEAAYCRAIFSSMLVDVVAVSLALVEPNLRETVIVVELDAQSRHDIFLSCGLQLFASFSWRQSSSLRSQQQQQRLVWRSGGLFACCVVCALWIESRESTFRSPRAERTVP